MKKFNFSHLVKLTTVALTSLFLVCFTGCQQQTPETKNTTINNYYLLSSSVDNKLVGTWSSTYGETFITTAYSFEAKNTYAGNNAVFFQKSDTEGTVFVRYTEIYDWSKGQTTEPADKTGWLNSYGSWYPLNKALVGKWYAISYKNLTATSVEISGAYKKDGKSATDTLQEAISEFTVENGYFGTYSSCTKK